MKPILPLLLSLCLLPVQIPARGADTAGTTMARTLWRMMEAMARAMQEGREAADLGDYTWPPPGWEEMYGPGGGEWNPLPQYRSARPVSRLEGTWFGNAGDILVFHGVRFRIFKDARHFTEGIFRIDGPLLSLTNPATGITRFYQYALQEGRLVLRDEAGNLLLYKRFSKEAFANPFKRFRGAIVPPPGATLPRTPGATAPPAFDAPIAPLRVPPAR